MYGACGKLSLFFGLVFSMIFGLLLYHVITLYQVFIEPINLFYTDLFCLNQIKKLPDKHSDLFFLRIHGLCKKFN